jgi:hypothetical protein
VKKKKKSNLSSGQKNINLPNNNNNDLVKNNYNYHSATVGNSFVKDFNKDNS